jgi:hypothetical protein
MEVASPFETLANLYEILGVRSQQNSILEELDISHVQIYFGAVAHKSQAPGRRSE